MWPLHRRDDPREARCRCKNHVQKITFFMSLLVQTSKEIGPTSYRGPGSLSGVGTKHSCYLEINQVFRIRCRPYVDYSRAHSPGILYIHCFDVKITY